MNSGTSNFEKLYNYEKRELKRTLPLLGTFLSIEDINKFCNKKTHLKKIFGRKNFEKLIFGKKNPVECWKSDKLVKSIIQWNSTGFLFFLKLCELFSESDFFEKLIANFKNLFC